MKQAKIILLSSPKGGCGKSSLSRNILVLAAQAGCKVVGLDLDAQGTLRTWADRRARVRASIPQLTDVPVLAATLGEWRFALEEARKQADVVVIDTPPSIELNLNAIVSLAGEADLILIPCTPTQDDIDSVGPWMSRLLGFGANAVFVMNRANRRTKSFTAIRAKLLSAGPVCPVEIPLLEEIPLAAGKGLGVMDLTRPASGETFEGLWSYVAREVDRQRAAA
jgi:chromosome partitioning protein